MCCNCEAPEVKIMLDVALYDGEDGSRFYPQKAHESDAGYDISSAADGSVYIAPGSRILIPAGFRMALPIGYEAQIRSRSGNAFKKGLMVLNSPGTIDANYRGVVGVILYNTSDKSIEIKRGDKIAQMVIQKLPAINMNVVDSLDETDRGEGGFGSTGVVGNEKEK